MRSSEHEIPGAARKTARESACRHFRLALQYAVTGSRPIALVVMGRIASGKSSLAIALSQELGWDILSSDQTRKQLAGVRIFERPDAAVRSRLYSSAMTRKTYAALSGEAVQCLKRGRSVILDATFSRRKHRQRLRAQLDRLQVNYCFIELRTSSRMAKLRLRKRDSSAREISDARLEDFEPLNRGYEPPAELPSNRLVRIEARKALEATLAATLKSLVQLHVMSPLPAT